MRHAVEDVVQHAATLRDASSVRPRDAGFVAAGVGLLQQQRRDQRDQVGVPAAFAQTVQGALDLPRAGVDGRQRVGHGVAGVVVGVDAQTVAGDAEAITCAVIFDISRAACRRWCRTARSSARPRHRRLSGIQRIIGVGLVAVEEMLRVKQRLAALCHQMRD